MQSCEKSCATPSTGHYLLTFKTADLMDYCKITFIDLLTLMTADDSLVSSVVYG